MKIRKTRIKKTTKANSSVQYVAEYKWGFWWYSFGDMMAPDSECRALAFLWRAQQKEVKHTEEEAKSLIDYYIAQVKHRNASEMENKVVKVEYEGYP